MERKNICNICGANYEFKDGKWVCPACGAYSPEEISNEISTLLYQAEQALRIADFDRAELLYSDIIEKDPKGYAGYWGRLRAKHGIKLEKDRDGKIVPTCFMQFDSLLNDSDFCVSQEFADPSNRSIMKKYVDYLETVRKSNERIAKTEKPYDVFICYKKTEEEGTPTPESKWGRDLYESLTRDCHLRVFFAEKSLQQSNEEWEPHIFSALQSAKIMFVLTSSIPHMESVWVKNEWRRFSRLIKEHPDKCIRVIYENVSPADFPIELRKTQAIDQDEKEWLENAIQAANQACNKKPSFTISDSGDVVLDSQQDGKRKEQFEKAYQKVFNEFNKIYETGKSSINISLSEWQKQVEVLLQYTLFEISLFDQKLHDSELALITEVSHHVSLLRFAREKGFVSEADLENESLFNSYRLLLEALHTNVILFCQTAETAFSSLPAKSANKIYKSIKGDMRKLTKILAGADDSLQRREMNAGKEFERLLDRMAFVTIAKTKDAQKQKRELHNQKRNAVSEKFSIVSKKTIVATVFIIAIAIASALVLINKPKEPFEFTKIDGGYRISSSSSYQFNALVEIPSEYNGEKIIEIGESAFSDHTEIEEMILPNALTVIKANAFAGCSNLETVRFKNPDGNILLKKINDKAFYQCGALSAFPMTNQLLYIGEQAFAGTELQSFSISESVIEIKAAAFDQCPKLNTIYLVDLKAIPDTWNTEWMGNSSATIKKAYTCTLVGAHSASVRISENDSFTLEQPIAKAGYHFLGYETEGTQVTDQFGKSLSDAIITKSCILEPIWEANTNVIVFDPNGGSGEMKEIQCKTGEEIPLPVCAYEKENCIFAGWSTQKNGQVLFNNAALYRMGTNEKVTLYAVWLKTASVVRITKDENNRNKTITNSDKHKDFVDPKMNIQELQKQGYTSFEIKITYLCREIDDGYQELSVLSATKNLLHEFKTDHGDGSLNESWGTYTKNCKISLNDVGTNGEIWLEWSASGWFANDWILGETDVQFIAVRE